MSPTSGGSGVVGGTFGDATHVAQVTVDAHGNVTDAKNVAIAFPAPSFAGCRATGSLDLHLGGIVHVPWALDASPTGWHVDASDPSRLVCDQAGWYLGSLGLTLSTDTNSTDIQLNCYTSGINPDYTLIAVERVWWLPRMLSFPLAARFEAGVSFQVGLAQNGDGTLSLSVDARLYRVGS